VREEAWDALGISYDDFIRTTEPRHYESVQKFLAVLSVGVPLNFQDHDLRSEQLILLRMHSEEVLGHPPEVWRILGEKEVHDRGVEVDAKFVHGSRGHGN